MKRKHNNYNIYQTGFDDFVLIIFIIGGIVCVFALIALIEILINHI